MFEFSSINRSIAEAVHCLEESNIHCPKKLVAPHLAQSLLTDQLLTTLPLSLMSYRRDIHKAKIFMEAFFNLFLSV
jgi:hypothetical protein